ncbi:DotU family type VI secretion system protein [Halopseudomonas salegens]|uniref:Type VI secretion system protein ImpK n=1 Tax=Halopseudomonas salegens TaxID=1434072 RepID=A0A1H2E068_9GAMM|nr:DotU family type VI secretion system protein [Halopseudomonas salegens]SDT88501.1 type VI secretion system protein ImpK [Halopseudomonas salegens]
MTQHHNTGRNSTDRVFAVPNPGGSEPRQADTPAAFQFADEFQIHSGSNRLIAAANPLLNLIYQIRTLVHNSEPEKLRDYLVKEIKSFESRAKSQGIARDDVMAARYCLCTVLDETAAQTPWGGSGTWSKHSLLVTFHNETWGGEKFFQLLAKLSQSPSQHVDLLEMMYYCICLGFEGRYKVVNNGRTQLESLRARLAEIIKTHRDEYAKALSLNWRGVEAAASKVWNVIPVWVSLLVALLIGFMVFVLFTFKLADKSDFTFSAISRLEVPELPKVAPSPPVQARFTRFLLEEINAGLVSVDETPEYSRVIILGDGLYDSGSATVRNRYLPVLDKIGAALQAAKGDVVIAGHSDNIPIRTIRFPSNWHLSLERANSVAAILSRSVTDVARISTVGRAELEPVVSNDTAEGRAMNRRVEITIFATPAELTFEIK